MNRNGKINLLIMLATATCVIGAGLMQPRLRTMRSRIMPATAASLEHASPIVAFTTVALGGLRGLLIDMLWARATELQDEKRFVEIVQLSDWITSLEPRLDVVWDFQSFNMAYNISAMFYDPRDRWRWITEGIRMLRDRALPNNPQSIMLHDRLCRIYQHKLVQPIDPAHAFYRTAFAREMETLLGGPEYSSNLLKVRPELVETVFDRHKLDAAVADRMSALYGNLDWRLGSTHIVYWSLRGSELIPETDRMGFDLLIADALSSAVLEGKIINYDPRAGTMSLAPRLDLLDAAVTHYHQSLDNYAVLIDGRHPFATRYVNFLRAALITAFDLGSSSQAASLQNLLATRAGDPTSELPLADYVSHLRTAPPLIDQLESIREDALKQHALQCDQCQTDSHQH